MNSSFFFQLFLVWGYYELIKAQQVCVCVYVSLHLSEISADEHNCWVAWQLLWASQVVKNLPANMGDTGVLLCRFDPWVRKIPGEEMATHLSILAWKTPWAKAGYSPWGCKALDTTYLLSAHTHGCMFGF